MPAVRRTRLMEAVWRLHPRLYRLSGGRIGRSLGGMPILVLHTVGRRTGQSRTNALMHFADGDRWVVIASNAGEPKHPAWWLNLRDGPETEIEIRGRTHRVRAREAEGEEREELWRKLLELNTDYETYRERAGGRRIPVVVLDPVEPVSSS